MKHPRAAALVIVCALAAMLADPAFTGAGLAALVALAIVE